MTLSSLDSLSAGSRKFPRRRQLPPIRTGQQAVATEPAAPTRRDLLRSAAATVGLAALPWPGASPARAAGGGFQPKFAICNETFGDWPFERAYALAAECGYQGIEIAPFTIANDVRQVSAARRRELRRQVEQSGLTMVGLHWLLARTTGFHLTSPDRDVRRRTAQYLGALAEFCAELGGDLLVFGSPQQRNLAEGVTFERGLQHAAQVLQESMPVMEKTNVRIAMEPLAPGTTNFLRTAAEAMQLVQRVASPRCQLILDCNAMKGETAPRVDLIREYHSHLIHFHANDPNSQGPGFGELDFVPILQALRDIDYSHWISVEVFDYQPGAERLARESIAYMQKCLAATRG
jgi:sugar phosphate isomerase/epimerase